VPCLPCLTCLTCPTRATCRIPFGGQTPLYVPVCRFDELDQGGLVDVPFGSQFDMPHALAGPFQEPGRVGQFGAVKKAHIDIYDSWTGPSAGSGTGRGSAARDRRGMSLPVRRAYSR
jgi:hypothetical protein